jgi:hypothetical protein
MCGQRCCSDFQRIITGDLVKLSVLSALEEVVNANADDVLLCHKERLSDEQSEERCVLDTDDGTDAGDAQLSAM